MIKALTVGLLIATAICQTVSAKADPIPTQFDSQGEDRQAIEELLSTYTKAVSTKNQALYETLLLNKDIPFSGASSAIKKAADAEHPTQNYESFRKGVFEGPPFTQRFQNVTIQQDGPLAQVSLVYVNTAPDGSNWGWKTVQLLKIAGHWKIVSEFYNGHAG